MIDAIDQFMQAGGEVLYLIAFTTFIMWTLIIERFCFFLFVLPQQKQDYLGQWQQRHEFTSWYAHKIRALLTSKVKLSIQTNLKAIKTLIALCPLLGLLGTVWGMIEVFNALAATAGDAKAMASGVSKATIPTMAGMVASLSGMFANTFIERLAERESHLFQDSLITQANVG
ncbi:MAG: MotA/TolQ/ExbB proton channel family protein [Sinobacterium sp.]|nr:MotA/TolQ/ExbB proton channel family protein [Sinobacterium sp.]